MIELLKEAHQEVPGFLENGAREGSSLGCGGEREANIVKVLQAVHAAGDQFHHAPETNQQIQG